MMGSAVQERRIRPKDLAGRLGFSIPTLYRRIDSGQIKKPQKDGGCVYWLESYVQKILAPESEHDEISTTPEKGL